MNPAEAAAQRAMEKLDKKEVELEVIDEMELMDMLVEVFNEGVEHGRSLVVPPENGGREPAG